MGMRTLNEYFLQMEMPDVSALSSVAYAVVPDTGKVVRIMLGLHNAITGVDALVSPFIGNPLAVSAVAEGDPDTDNFGVTTGAVPHGLKVGDVVTHWTDFVDAAYEGVHSVAVISSTVKYEVVGVYTATGTGTMCKNITCPTAGITIPYSGSAKGDVIEVIPSGENLVKAGEIIGIYSNGASTTTSKLTATFVIDR